MEDECFREPYIGKFQLKKGSEPFYLVNFHSRVFSKNPEKEIVFFDEYPKRLKTDRIFIVGDFNLNENPPHLRLPYRQATPQKRFK